MSTIFVKDGTGKLHRLEQQPYAQEAVLQELLAQYPELLPGDLIDPEQPRKWLLVRREVGVASDESGGGRWSVDHLFIDQDAIPTIVETKRSQDTRIRREVIGQLLEYAANAVAYWQVSELEEEFRARCSESSLDPEEVLRGVIGMEREPADFWESVRTNLRAGKVRLVLVADQVPPEMRRIVEFLNLQMKDTELLAVEVRHFPGDNFTTLVPYVYGRTEQAAAAKGSSGSRKGTQWDRDRLLQDVENRCGAAGVAIVERILEWSAEANCELWWGQGTTAGSFTPWFPRAAGRDSAWPLFTVYSSGKVEISFHHWRRAPLDSPALRLEILGRLNELPGVALPDSAITKLPNVSFSVLEAHPVLDRFLAVFSDLLGQLGSHAAATVHP